MEIINQNGNPVCRREVGSISALVEKADRLVVRVQKALSAAVGQNGLKKRKYQQDKEVVQKLCKGRGARREASEGEGGRN